MQVPVWALVGAPLDLPNLPLTVDEAGCKLHTLSEPKETYPPSAVEEAGRKLIAAGFQLIVEKEAWSIKAGGKYFFTRNMTTIVAFAVGAKYQPGNGFYMVGAHTDSPCLKLRPVTKVRGVSCALTCDGVPNAKGGVLWEGDIDEGEGDSMMMAGRGFMPTPWLPHLQHLSLRVSPSPSPQLPLRVSPPFLPVLLPLRVPPLPAAPPPHPPWCP